MMTLLSLCYCSGAKIGGGKAYGGSDIGRADIADVLKSALGPTRYGLLPYHPHGVFIDASLVLMSLARVDLRYT